MEKISGTGEKTIQELFKHFNSVKEISEAKPENLQKAVGKQKAKQTYNYFQKNKDF